MKRTKLSSNEIKDLIHKYKSELKKLEFQASDIDRTISQLEGLLKKAAGAKKSSLKNKKTKSTSSNKVASKKKGKKGRPRKKAVAATKTANIKKAAAKKKVVKSKLLPVGAKKKSQPKPYKKAVQKTGYRLTFWDEYVIESIKQAGKVRITQEIVDYVSSKLQADGKSFDIREIQNKVIRSLQKLVNRRNELKKVPFEGKGLAYALPTWFAENGKLNKEYKR